MNENLEREEPKQARKPRRKTQITAHIAAEIYLLKHPKFLEDGELDPDCQAAGNSVAVSQLFGISPKSVRDIWNR